MAIIVTDTIPKALKPGVKQFWGDYSEEDTMFSKMLDVETTTEAFDEFVQVSTFGKFDVKGEGAPVNFDSMAQGYITRATQRTRALGYIISWEAKKFQKYLNAVVKGNKALSRSLKITKESDGAAIFNNGFDSSYTYGDGKVFFASDHPMRSGGTFSNILSTSADLSEPALESLLIQINKAIDDRGLKINLKAKKLFVSPDNIFNADRLTQSILRTGTNNNDVNAIYNMRAIPEGYMSNPFLTSENSFFIRTDAMEQPKFLVAEEGMFSSDGDFDTEDTKFKMMTSYATTVVDPRAYYASEGV